MLDQPSLYFQQQGPSAWLDSWPGHGVQAALAWRPQSRGFLWSLEAWLLQLLLSLSLSLTQRHMTHPSVNKCRPCSGAGDEAVGDTGSCVLSLERATSLAAKKVTHTARHIVN